jgi:hypothetical protein
VHIDICTPVNEKQNKFHITIEGSQLKDGNNFWRI